MPVCSKVRGNVSICVCSVPITSSPVHAVRVPTLHGSLSCKNVAAISTSCFHIPGCGGWRSEGVEQEASLSPKRTRHGPSSNLSCSIARLSRQTAGAKRHHLQRGPQEMPNALPR
ncbi:hypothetical protein K469DRAFT_288941 [Zopfia rhizophila CBS 207.26]|uniref:Uncharacterized protein n=1 Tax=Zopfia rhizophila CBS 207.26 TaxID=1314779 RepID=A0A6A6ET81_9PEZI|nr:hypothetical protein K469DRAFT_288941 [Zopfia rhizophila CBS 207.26]